MIQTKVEGINFESVEDSLPDKFQGNILYIDPLYKLCICKSDFMFHHFQSLRCRKQQLVTVTRRVHNTNQMNKVIFTKGDYSW